MIDESMKDREEENSNIEEGQYIGNNRRRQDQPL